MKKSIWQTNLEKSKTNFSFDYSKKNYNLLTQCPSNKIFFYLITNIILFFIFYSMIYYKDSKIKLTNNDWKLFIEDFFLIIQIICLLLFISIIYLTLVYNNFLTMKKYPTTIFICYSVLSLLLISFGSYYINYYDKFYDKRNKLGIYDNIRTVNDKTKEIIYDYWFNISIVCLCLGIPILLLTISNYYYC